MHNDTCRKYWKNTQMCLNRWNILFYEKAECELGTKMETVLLKIDG